MEGLLERQVARIELEKEGGGYRATGMTEVTVVDGDIIHARIEVILSAGTIQSSHLLELLGIGNCDILREADVEQKIELSGVGENLQDHPRIQLSYVHAGG